MTPGGVVQHSWPRTMLSCRCWGFWTGFRSGRCASFIAFRSLCKIELPSDSMAQGLVVSNLRHTAPALLIASCSLTSHPGTVKMDARSGLSSSVRQSVRPFVHTRCWRGAAHGVVSCICLVGSRMTTGAFSSVVETQSLSSLDETEICSPRTTARQHTKYNRLRCLQLLARDA